MVEYTYQIPANSGRLFQLPDQDGPDWGFYTPDWANWLGLFNTKEEAAQAMADYDDCVEKGVPPASTYLAKYI